MILVNLLVCSISALSNLELFWLSGTDQGHEGCWVWGGPQVILSHFTNANYSWVIYMYLQVAGGC